VSGPLPKRHKEEKGGTSPLRKGEKAGEVYSVPRLGERFPRSIALKEEKKRRKRRHPQSPFDCVEENQPQQLRGGKKNAFLGKREAEKGLWMAKKESPLKSRKGFNLLDDRRKDRDVHHLNS